MACTSVLMIVAWLYWGRTAQLAIALAAAGGAVAMLRYLEIAAFVAGFFCVANLGAFLPGSTSAFFAGVFLIITIRKLIKGDMGWRYGAILLPASLFVAYFQISGLWADQDYFYDWDLLIRVLPVVFVMVELANSRRQFLVFFVGCAVGMTFSSVSAIRTATDFYASGVADQIAGTVTNIESSRFFGHWPDPNIMSMTLTTYLGGVIALWRSRLGIVVRAISLVAVVTTIAAVLMSLSRSGVLTCGIVILMMLAVERRRLVLFAIVSMVLIVLMATLPVDLFGRFAKIASGMDNSSSERFSLLIHGWSFFWNNPIFGSGIGGFENGILYKLSYLPHGFFSHNTLVDIAVDGGLVAVTLFVFCLIPVFNGLSWSNWRPDPNDSTDMLNAGLRSGLVATIFSMLTMSSVAYVPFWVYFTLCAMFAVTCRRSGVVTAVAAA